MPNDELNNDERAELEKFREQKRKNYDYRNKYAKENYKHMVCSYPIRRSNAVDEAMKQANAKSVSSYITSLIDRDLKEKGLWND